MPGKANSYWHMEADRSEMNDLVDAHPDIVKELAELHDAWAKRCGVIPWDELNEMRKKRAAEKK